MIYYVCFWVAVRRFSVFEIVGVSLLESFGFIAEVGEPSENVLQISVFKFLVLDVPDALPAAIRNKESDAAFVVDHALLFQTRVGAHHGVGVHSRIGGGFLTEGSLSPSL